jgi:hypothetical protein
MALPLPPKITTSSVDGTTVKLAWKHAQVFEYKVYRSAVGGTNTVVATVKTKNVTLTDQPASPSPGWVYGVAAVDHKGLESAMAVVTLMVEAPPPPATAILGFYYDDDPLRSSDQQDDAQCCQDLAAWLSGAAGYSAIGPSPGEPPGDPKPNPGLTVTAGITGQYCSNGTFADIGTSSILNGNAPPPNWTVRVGLPMCPNTVAPNRRTDPSFSDPPNCSMTAGSPVVLDPQAVSGDVGQTLEVAGSGTSGLDGYVFLGYIDSVDVGVGYTLDRDAPVTGTSMHFYVGNSLAAAVAANISVFEQIAGTALNLKDTSGNKTLTAIWGIGYEINGNYPAVGDGEWPGAGGGNGTWPQFPGPDIKAAFSAIAVAIRGVYSAAVASARCLIDFTVNASGGPAGQLFQCGEPIADVCPYADVDIIGADVYWQPPQAVGQPSGTPTAAQVAGYLMPWVEDAFANGKGWAVPEWGAGQDLEDCANWLEYMSNAMKGLAIPNPTSANVFEPVTPATPTWTPPETASFHIWFATTDNGETTLLPLNMTWVSPEYLQAFGV